MPISKKHVKPQSALLGAVAWMGGTILSFVTLAVSIRELSAAIGPFQIQFLRSLIGLTIVATIVLARTSKVPISRQWRLTVTRNIIHVAGQVLWTIGLGILPLAMVFALEFTSPIWATLLAVLLLGERLSVTRIVSVLMGFFGILVIVRPGLGGFEPAMLFVLSAAVCFGFINIATKRLTRTDTPTCIVFWMCAMQAVILAPLGILYWEALPGALWPWAVALGFAGLSAHFCLTSALSLADALTVLPMEYLRLPAIGFVGAMVYAEPLDFWIYGGAALIMTGVYVNLRREYRQARR